MPKKQAYALGNKASMSQSFPNDQAAIIGYTSTCSADPATTMLALSQTISG